MKVSVCMITYGHENFIREAIEGVLMQKCDFEIELIIANDCSPDNTDQVIQEILQNNPKASQIKYIRHEKNVGMMPNFIFALKECKGEYIAICEGDDYWIDSLKLQKQVDFLDSNSEYAIHSGAAKVLRDNQCDDEFIGLDQKDAVFSVENFLSQNNLVTCTVMFRNNITAFPKEFYKTTFGDWFLYAILLKSGLKAYRSTSVFSVYRIHDGGVMMSLSLLKSHENHIRQIIALKKLLGYKKYSDLEINRLNYYSLEKFRLEVKNKILFGAVKTGLVNFRQCAFKTPFRGFLSTIKQQLI